MWLERAAAAGSTDAQLAFAENALAEFGGDRGALIAGIEEAARRRERAATWLRRLIHAGNERALVLAVQDPHLAGHQPDSVEHEAHRHAWDLVRGSRSGDFAGVWSDGPERYDLLAPAQWDEVARRGRQIYSDHFGAR